MKVETRNTFKCLVTLGGCRLWLMVTHTCCGDSSHQTGAVTHHGLCPSPSTFVSAARLQLIWRMLIHDRCFCSRSGKEQEVKSLFCFLTVMFLLSPRNVLEVNQAGTIQSSVGSCCAMVNLSSDTFIPSLWTGWGQEG